MDTPFAKALTDPQLRAIGQVVVESAWLERLVEFYIQRLARLTPKKADSFLDGRMMSSKIELLKMLGRSRLKTPKDRDDFSDLLAKATAANTDRNTVVHGVWSKKDLADAREIAQAKKRTSPGNHKIMAATEITRVAKDVAAAFWILYQFGEDHWPTARQKRDAALLAASRSRSKKQPTPPDSRPRP